MSDPQETPDTTEATAARGKQRKRRPDAPVPAEVAIRGKGPRPAGEGAIASGSMGPVTVSMDVDFEALMGSGAGSSEPAGSFARGARVSGVVEAISQHGDEVFLDLGHKATGWVLKDELRDAEGNLVVKVGDTIEGTVAGHSPHGIQVRTKLGQEATSAAIREAFEGGLVVEGKVVAHNKGGYEVEIGKNRAFCPHSQIDTIRVENPETMVGRVFDFKITELRDGNSPVVSRTVLLKQQAATRAAELMAKLAVGQVVRGRVRNIQSFGVFVDLGGKDGLIPMGELAWGRVQDANEIVKIGDEVDVAILEISQNGDRIGLSLRKAQEDPFESAAAKLQAGQIVNGVVRRLETYGAFIELAPNVEGLVHISDMAHYRVRHPKDLLKVGESVRVKVQEIDVDRHRISLSLKALAADPWEDVATRYAPGTEVRGTVEKIADFGVFITIEAGITGLLPGSEANLSGRSLVDEFRVGKEVEARILRVDAAERKIALTRRDAEEIARMAERGADPRQRRSDTLREVRENRGPRDDRPRGGPATTVAYRDEDATGGGKGSVGSFGEALMKALGGKKGK
jgi:small subunit ribosomal protein S1